MVPVDVSWSSADCPVMVILTGQSWPLQDCGTIMLHDVALVVHAECVHCAALIASQGKGFHTLHVCFQPYHFTISSLLQARIRMHRMWRFYVVSVLFWAAHASGVSQSETANIIANDALRPNLVRNQYDFHFATANPCPLDCSAMNLAVAGLTTVFRKQECSRLNGLRVHLQSAEVVVQW